MDIEESIWKHALKNAAKYGRTDAGKLVGKVLGDVPEARAQMKAIMPEIQEIAAKVNAMPKEEQEAMLKERFPETLERKEHDLFASISVKGPVITAFPPDPSKYPHLGHAKAALINYTFAKRHGGRFYLRFEDTNPLLPKLEFYEQFKSDLAWVGIVPDEVFYASDYLDYLAEVITAFLMEGRAYVCTCDPDTIKRSREKAIACACRGRDPAESLELFEKMQLGGIPEGEAIVRLKIDLAHKNSTMRDPTVYRIIEHPHPRVGRRTRVWPNYDFQNAILDGRLGVTHRFRSKEFELRNELQGLIQGWAGFPRTHITEFGRFNLEGIPSSGRIIREKIASKEFIGWDDPMLHTLVALRRRGFTPEGIRNFLLATGITKNEATLTWDDLILTNRRIIDRTANRYFFVADPVAITVEGTPAVTVGLRLHPEEAEKGRRLAVDGHFLVAKADKERIDALPEGSMVRCMDAINFRKEKGRLVFDSAEVDAYKAFKGEKIIIHWLPKEGNAKATVFMPDHALVEGAAEPTIKGLKRGDLLQFERFGFCRLDAIDGDTYRFWFTHG